MKTVCAESVLRGREAFSTLGDVTVLPDRKIGRTDLQDAQILAIRSKTRADEALLAGTSVRFVGTATAGFDHMDISALDRLGVAWSAAPGSNADSVAEYVACALLRLSCRTGRPLAGLTLGIIGVGQVGSRVARVASALGMRTLLNDPPRQRKEPENTQLVSLDETLAGSDIVTLHVPLSDDAPDATRNMAHDAFFGKLKEGVWFFNASRGEVVHEPSLWKALESGRIAHIVLDVFNREPEVDPKLALRTDLATPHIAGYSTDGKLNGTVQIYREACRVFGIEPSWDPAVGDTPAPTPRIELDPGTERWEVALDRIVRQVYEIESDDAPLRAAAAKSPAVLASEFERLRKTYPDRREFFHTTVRLAPPHPALDTALRGLRFRSSEA
ncbi:MAG: 4-phosphoerythronate dehydrogenase [Kiritimatiellia bacterium]|nr:4-phosphoerythronate dehydrogenase [Kiritimatiellia bacterium]